MEMEASSFSGHGGVSFWGKLPEAGPEGDRGATIRVDQGDGRLLFSATTVGTLGADGQVKGMYKGGVPGVAGPVEAWFASTFDAALVRRLAGARSQARIVVTPVPRSGRRSASRSPSGRTRARAATSSSTASSPSRRRIRRCRGHDSLHRTGTRPRAASST